MMNDGGWDLGGMQDCCIIIFFFYFWVQKMLFGWLGGTVDVCFGSIGVS
jgi:hypothetical protein